MKIKKVSSIISLIFSISLPSYAYECPSISTIFIKNDRFVAHGPEGLWEDAYITYGHTLPVFMFLGAEGLHAPTFPNKVLKHFRCQYETLDGYSFWLNPPGGITTAFKMQGKNWKRSGDPDDYPLYSCNKSLAGCSFTDGQ